MAAPILHVLPFAEFTSGVFAFQCAEEFLVLGSDMLQFVEYQFSSNGSSLASTVLPHQGFVPVTPMVVFEPNPLEEPGFKACKPETVAGVCAAGRPEYSRWARGGETVLFRAYVNDPRISASSLFVLTNSEHLPDYIFKNFNPNAK